MKIDNSNFFECRSYIPREYLSQSVVRPSGFVTAVEEAVRASVLSCGKRSLKTPKAVFVDKVANCRICFLSLITSVMERFVVFRGRQFMKVRGHRFRDAVDLN
jgi:hypothetical protein